METILTLGVPGVTPLVVQFILDAVSGKKSKALDNRIKMILSVLVGGALSVLLQMYMIHQGQALEQNTLAWIFTLVDGFASGAIATGGYSIAKKVIDKASQ